MAMDQRDEGTISSTTVVPLTTSYSYSSKALKTETSSKMEERSFCGYKNFRTLPFYSMVLVNKTGIGTFKNTY